MPRAGATQINTSSGAIGDTVDSFLSEVQFQSQRGTNWVLSDGRNVAGSRYQTITGSATVPDLRGVSRRGKNNGRADGNQNPAGELALGTFQTDNFQGHEHLMNGLNNTGAQNDALVVVGARTLHNYAAFSAGQTQNNKTTGALQTDGVSGAPRSTTETRVKNVTCNTFIKIN